MKKRSYALKAGSFFRKAGARVHDLLSARTIVRARREMPLMEEYEARLLYSADLAPVGLDLAAAFQGVEQRTMDALGEFVSGPIQAETVRRTELLVVGTGIDDVATILSGLEKQGRDIEILMLESGKDSIEQISAALRERQDLQAIHILSHGSSGRLDLGETALDAVQLQGRAQEIAAWGKALSADGDILLYGCDVASDAAGQAFVRNLSSLTGADVAASSDATGNAFVDADWTLEYASGHVESSLVVGAAAQAQWHGTLASQANSVLSDTQTGASVAIAADGSSVVVWTTNGNQDGNGEGVFGRRFDAAGNPIGSQFQINTDFAGNQKEAVVGMDAAGNFVVAWTSTNGTPADNLGSSIHAQRFNANGSKAGAEFVVNQVPDGNQERASIAVAGNGQFVVAWSANTNGKDVYLRHFDASGNALSGDILVNDGYLVGNQEFASVAIASDGSYVVAWQSDRGGSGKSVFAQRFDTTDTRRGANFMVNTFDNNDQTAPSVAIGANGTFVIAWTSAGQDGDKAGVYAQIFQANGTRAGGEILVNEFTQHDQSAPSVAMAGDGGFIVAWTGTNHPSGDKKDVFLRRFNADGSASGSEIRLNSFIASDQLNVVVAMNARGDYAAAWEGDSATDNAGIMMANFVAANAAPAAVADAISTDQDTPAGSAAPGLLANDSDPDIGAILSIIEAQANGAVAASAVSAGGVMIAGAYGSLFLRSDGSYTYTPNASAKSLGAGQTAVDVFYYTVRDENNATASSTLSVTVSGLNDAPVATGDTYAVSKSDTLDVGAAGVLSNDTDLDQMPAPARFVAAVNGDPGLVGTVVAGIYGTFVLNANGSFSYVPDTDNPDVAALQPGDTLVDAFTYTVSDGTQTATASIQIDVQGANTAPQAADDGGYAVDEDGTLTVGSGAGVLFNDSDPEGNALSAILVSGPAHGTLTLNADGSFVYTPDALYSGTDSFTYRASDGSLQSGLGTVTVAVNHVNHAPQAVDDAGSVAQDATLTVVAADGVLDNDDDVDAQDTLSVSQIQSGSTVAAVGGTPGVITTQYGTLTMHADGSYSYVADGAASKALAAGTTTSDIFSYTVSDGAGGAALTTLVITITGSNDLPVISGTVASQATDDQSSLSPFSSIDFSDIDSLAQTLTLTITLDDAAKGSLSNLGGGSYNAATGVYMVSGTAAQVTAAARNLVFTAAGNRVAPGLAETTSFSINVGDGLGSVQDSTTTVMTTSVNDLPQANDDTGAVNQDATLTVPATGGVLDNDTDADVLAALSVGEIQSGSTVASVIAGTPGVITTQYGTLTMHADGSYSYVADGTASKALAAGETAEDTFIYRVDDGEGGQETAQLVITVTGTNDTPVIAGTVSAQASDDHSSLSPFATVSFTDVDSPAQTLTVTITLDSQAKGVLSNVGVGSYNAATGVYTVSGTASDVTAAVRNLVFTPAANRVAPGSTETTTFTIAVDDGAASVQDSGTSVVSTSINDAPQASDDGGYAVDEDGSLTVGSGAGVLFNDSDPEGNALSAILVSGPAHGTLTLNADGSFVYTPDALYFGTDSFTYRASDGSLQSGLGTVTIAVNHVNHAPQAVDDAGSVAQDATLTVVAADGVLDNDDDVDAQDTLSVSQIQSGSTVAAVGGTPGVITTQYGTLTMHADGSYSYVADGAASKALALGATATESFIYTVADGAGGSDTATLSITITGRNDAPAITGTLALQATDDKSTVSPFAGVSFSDVDSPGQAITVTITLDNAGKGSFSSLGTGSYNAVTGVYTVSGTASDVTAAVRNLVFTPGANRTAPGMTETTVFSVLANDGLGSTQDTTASVVSTSVNDAPQVLAVSASDLQSTGNPVAVTLLGTDPDNAVASFRLAQLPANGQLFLDAGGQTPAQLNTPIAAAANRLTLYFKPNSGWSGTSTFSYRATDSAGMDSAGTALVSITVNVLPAASPASDPAPEPGTPVPEPLPEAGKPNETTPPVNAAVPEPAKDSGPELKSAAPAEAAEQPMQDLEQTVQRESIDPLSNDRQQPRTAARAAAAGFMPAAMNLDVFSFDALSVGNVGLGETAEDSDSEGLRSALQADTMTKGFDMLRENLKESEEMQQKVVGSSIVAGTSMSVGYVIWLLRGGVLATSLMSSLPAWRFIDPLPVLAKNGKPVGEPTDESLESMVQDGGQAHAPSDDAQAGEQAGRKTE